MSYDDWKTNAPDDHEYIHLKESIYEMPDNLVVAECTRMGINIEEHMEKIRELLTEYYYEEKRYGAP